MPLYGGPPGQEQGLPMFPGPGQPPPVVINGIEAIPIVINGQIIGYQLGPGGEILTPEEVQSLIATGAFPEGAAPSGPAAPAAPAWSTTEAAANLQFQHELELQIAADEARLKEIEFEQGLVFENERRLLEIRLENSHRELLYTQIGAERRTLIQEKGAMGRELLGLGPDPFKQSVTLSGGIQRYCRPHHPRRAPSP